MSIVTSASGRHHDVIRDTTSLQVPSPKNSKNKRKPSIYDRLDIKRIRGYIASAYTELKKKQQRENSYNRLILVFVTLLLFTLGLLVSGAGPAIQRVLVDKLFILKENSEFYKTWSTSNMTINNDIYIFNITNPDEIMAGAKVKLEQLGPFNYAVRMPKVTIEPNKETKTYKYNSRVKFAENTDVEIAKKTYITHLNLPYLEWKAQLSYSAVLGGLFGLKSSDLFLKHTVHELISGYDTGSMALTRYKLSPLEDDEELPANEVKQGREGQDNPQLQLVKYANSDNAGCWSKFYGKEPELDAFNNATEGLGFAPFKLEHKDTNNVYRSEFFRAIPYISEGYTYHHGWFIKSKHLVPQTYTPNFLKKYCVDPEYNCSDNIYHMPKCKDKALPMSISKPHFLHSNISLAGLEGISPSVADHESYLDVDPITGLTWKYKRSFQVNIGFNNKMIKYSSAFKYVHPDLLYIPVAWFDMHYTLPASSGGKPIAFLCWILRVIIGHLWAVLMACICTTVLTITVYLRYKDKRKNAIKEREERMKTKRRVDAAEGLPFLEHIPSAADKTRKHEVFV